MLQVNIHLYTCAPKGLTKTSVDKTRGVYDIFKLKELCKLWIWKVNRHNVAENAKEIRC